MATSPAPVRVDRIALTQTQLKAAEIMFYQMADIINRIYLDDVPYTKVKPEEVFNG